MDPNCLFCKISAKQIPSKLVYEDDDVFAFEDINPQAPTHIVICPRKHFAALQDAEPDDKALLGKLRMLAANMAREIRLLSGYLIFINNDRSAGQSLFHLHLHVLVGRTFIRPPGLY